MSSQVVGALNYPDSLAAAGDLPSLVLLFDWLPSGCSWHRMPSCHPAGILVCLCLRSRVLASFEVVGVMLLADMCSFKADEFLDGTAVPIPDRGRFLVLDWVPSFCGVCNPRKNSSMVMSRLWSSQYEVPRLAVLCSFLDVSRFSGSSSFQTCRGLAGNWFIVTALGRTFGAKTSRAPRTWIRF